MAIAECPREQEVFDAIATGRWPERSDAELRSHVSACASCGDLAMVAGPLIEARDAAWQDARVPASGTVWWRAQMRARREAARKAARPMTLVQAAGALAGIALLVALAAVAAPWLGNPLGEVTGLLSAGLPSITLPDIAALGGSWWIVLLVAGPFVILGPVAIYFAVSGE